MRGGVLYVARGQTNYKELPYAAGSTRTDTYRLCFSLDHHLIEAPPPESAQLVAISLCQFDRIRMRVDSDRDARLAQDVNHRVGRAVGPVAGIVLVLAGELVPWVLLARWETVLQPDGIHYSWQVGAGSGSGLRTKPTSRKSSSRPWSPSQQSSSDTHPVYIRKSSANTSGWTSTVVSMAVSRCSSSISAAKSSARSAGDDAVLSTRRRLPSSRVGFAHGQSARPITTLSIQRRVADRGHALAANRMYKL